MVCNFSQIFVAGHVCKKEQRREEEVKLYCSYVEVEEMKKVRHGGCVCASCWKLEDGPGLQCTFHYSVLL